ncbi:pyruvate dehydrogenase E2 component (dihydrolipoamide acetyltransferase) [Glycomyces sambucus]|uniref:Dihydrolipoamide acetyltransferase component of pyruvate dehydrogenase complex n=1 Tax=Glycomyces sambucus TaxID=380244 RepID=A0A1G9HCR4_9ACTN|nr:dihydrolipoamide acetyltransferase family protein [Glycomyces sambucus]SDL10616.1 pyruvate dehydrogenase E2 component (dihydrolipoamide acetyltransferase) [Glycomyces sambucus]
MGQKITFNLPDLGEGLTEGEVAAWLVEPGGEVKLNQPFVEVETAKALVEVPSPYDGVLAEHHAEAGTTVDVGKPLATFEVEGADAPAPAKEERTPNLVGYGAREAGSKRRKRKPGAPAEEPPAARSLAPVTPPSVIVPVTPPPVEAAPAAPAPVPPAPAAGAPTGPVLAKPPVRKLAKDLGVDLGAIVPTGPNGTVSRADVQAAVAGPAPAAPQRVAAAAEDQRIPIKGVRKLTAQNMVASAFTAPHVTVFLTCDVTGMMDTVKEFKARREFADVKVTPLLFVAKAVLLAARRHPMINARWDEAAQEIVVKHDVNLGIAAATPRGLVVPNVKAAQDLSLVELAEALTSLARTARDGKTTPADMAGGTLSITNVGVFGIDTGTPILPPGESAILVFGAVRPQPWVHEGEIAVRQVTTLGLSFDHRLIDGEQGSQFLADVGAFLSHPGETLLAWT